MAAPASATGEETDVTSCKAWVRTSTKYDPGDYENVIPGQEKVTLKIDLTPLKLRPLEVAVMRAVAGDRFLPALKTLELTETGYLQAEQNLEAAYTQARMLVDEARRLAAEIEVDSELPLELVMAQLGGSAWCERTSKWLGESADAHP